MAAWARWGLAAILGSLTACSSPLPLPPRPTPVAAAPRWVATGWTDLPGWGNHNLAPQHLAP